MSDTIACAGGISIGSLSHFGRRRTGLGLGVAYGCDVAHEQLLAGLLRHGVACSLDVFATSLSPQRSRHERELCESGASEVCGLSETRVRFRDLAELPGVAAASGGALCFVASGAASSRLAQMRSAIAGRFGITSLVHSAFWPDMLSHLMSLAAVTDERDALVFTSRASRHAFETAMAWSEQVSGIAFKGARHLIPLGVEVARERITDKYKARSILGLPEAAAIALYVGRLTADLKADLRPLVLAFAAQLERQPDALLVVAGNRGPSSHVEELMTVAIAAGCRQRLLVIESPSDIVRDLLLSTADVFVSPADNVQESFGLSLLEAMAFGLPVIASDWSGYREIVCDGETGWLIPTTLDPVTAKAMEMFAAVDAAAGVPGRMSQATVVDCNALTEALGLLLSRPDLRRAMGERGRRRADTMFSWAAVTKSYASVMAGQLDRCQSHRPERLSAFPFFEMFGGYASNVLQSEDCVTIVGAEGADACKRKLRSVGAEEIYESALRPPGVPVGNILTEHGVGAWQAVIELWKLGYLRRIESIP